VEQGRQIVRTSLAEQNLPGLSIAVGIGGNIVWAEGFGFADIENNRPVTPNDRFRIGSASSVLTSTAVGLLVEADRLKLDEKMQTYLPEFTEWQWPVTVRQVMGHVGGVKTEDVDNGVLTSTPCEGTADALKLFAKDPLQFQPGTEFRYSIFGWILLSAAVEAVADTPFTTFLQEKVLRPLGMQDTVKEIGKEPVPGEATAYVARFGGNPKYGLHPLFKFDYSCYAGSSGYLSTPSDLVRFGMAINSGKLLRRDTVDTLQTSLRLVSGAETGYGLGWNVKTVTVAGQNIRAAGTDGDFWGGQVASLLTLPERGIAVAVTSNIESADTSTLAEKIAQAFAAQ
jgi:CubicO group peptidase (beta-lactamase class C family)